MTLTGNRRRHISNSVYSVMDYASLPALMLISTPVLLHHLGPERYAIWILTSAATTSGYLVSSGFGDAAIKLICGLRGNGDTAAIEEVMRALLAVNIILSAVIASLIALSGPLLERHIPGLTASYRGEFLLSLLLGCVLLVMRSMESVFACVQRAYERYDIPASFSIAIRVLTIGLASLIAYCGGNTVAILLSTLSLTTAGVVLQAFAVRRRLPQAKLLPLFSAAPIQQLRGVGVFTWLQGMIGLLTSQADRLLVGLLLGTQALTYYTVSVQAAMPIHGITVASLQILFPYLASRLDLLHPAAIRRRIFIAFAVNVCLVVALSVPLLFGGRLILTLWLDADFASHAISALMASIIGFALMGLNVTGYFVLMAAGRMRLLAALNAIAAIAMLSVMAALSLRIGLTGALMGRIVFGALICLVYVPLLPILRGSSLRIAPTHKALEVAK